jgi:hypothetical protein
VPPWRSIAVAFVIVLFKMATMPITSSSICSSDGPSGWQSLWRRFAATYLAGAAVILFGILGAAYALDPYDTGRSSLLPRPGVRPQGPRTAGASRGRDPAFNAAVIGNSHVQLLSPERLNALTGLSFVQLSVPATGPKEQFILIDWFLRHHPNARALVIGADVRWCTADPAMPNMKPFPFWLYSRDPMEYGRGLLRYEVLEEIPRRIAYVLSKRPERARADGYWDYESNYIGLGRGPELSARLERDVTGYFGSNTTGRFPVAERLRQVTSSLPPRLAIVLVFPPVYARVLPEPDSAAGLSDHGCKAALAEAVSHRSSSALVDWRRSRPELREPAFFLDQTHYRRPLAELVETDVAGGLVRSDAEGGG